MGQKLETVKRYLPTRENLPAYLVSLGVGSLFGGIAVEAYPPRIPELVQQAETLEEIFEKSKSKFTIRSLSLVDFPEKGGITPIHLEQAFKYQVGIAHDWWNILCTSEYIEAKSDFTMKTRRNEFAKRGLSGGGVTMFFLGLYDFFRKKKKQ